MEKTFSTFHISNMLLQQQYLEKCFIKYSKLISCLLIVEQNNELIKNHKSRPTRTTFPKLVNVVNFNRGRGRGHSRGRDCERGKNNYYFRGHSYNPNFKRNTGNDDHKGKTPQNYNSKCDEEICYQCGMTRHWSDVCRASKHLIDLYPTSLEK